MPSVNWFVYYKGAESAMWKDEPMELTDVKVAALGHGNSRQLIGETMKFLVWTSIIVERANLNEKELNMTYLSLDELLGKVDILITDVWNKMLSY